MNQSPANQLSETSDTWLQQLPPERLNINILREACLFAENHPDSKPPPFAKSTLAQGLQMATVLLDLNCDNQTIAAAIVYPCVCYNQVSKETVIEKLGKTINKLLLGVQSMEIIHARAQAHTDNLRKMLLAMVDDIRVVLIKLAERLEILKYLKHGDVQQQKTLATQAMHIYAPLANRLGIWQLKWQLEDLSFRYLHPEEYKKISQALKMRRTEREQHINEMKQQLGELFEIAEIQRVKMSGRAKHIFSIYRKIMRKQVEISEIYDTSALRILVPTIKDCYTALSLVHANWAHIPKEFDDYIAKPKLNGYRSIHTAVIGPKNINVEIQIRTYKMHEEAELGVAAHWKYKEDNRVSDRSIYTDKINLLREVIDWQNEISVEDNTSETLYSQIFKDRIYVFSPNGDVYDLINEATPLDFAYHVHTELGHRCKGAKVNGVLVPLTHQLKTGDQVSILTAKTGQPSRDWLNPHLGYLHTPHAREKVRHYFKKLSREENLDAGNDIWGKIARREGYKKADLQQVIDKLNYKQVDDLIVALGAGDISVAAILQQFKPSKKSSDIETEAEISRRVAKKKSLKPSSNLTIAGVEDLLTQLARCCKPIPGDEIIGYITAGRGITIHQKTCRNIQQANEKRPEKIIEVNWEDTKTQTYPVGLLLTAEDRPGLIHDIAAIISNQHISILGLSTRLDTADNTAYISLTIEISSLEPLQKIINQLQQIPGMLSVVRQ